MFREDFVWGVASSAYQVEGRDPQDGAGKCIWDKFAEEGHTFGNQNGDVSCDNMHRYKEDYALMQTLGIKAYRFSISWARLIPEGTGAVNQKAVALYRDMIQEMKKYDIEPYLTLYHWELPQALEDKGGWLNEEIVDWFAEYAKVVAENFTDLCDKVFTLNEPQCFLGLGYYRGEHAPGRRVSVAESFQVVHNALRAHGKSVLALRKYARQPIQIGYAPTSSVAYPATNSPEDIEAARKLYFGFGNPIENWTWNVAWFSDPVILGTYPQEALLKYAQYLPKITKEDMELIHQPIDFLGQNIYNGFAVSAGADGQPVVASRPMGYAKTATDWPVSPDCLEWGIRFLYERYQLPIYITENGMSCHDNISADGSVHDPNRIQFLDEYISSMQRAADAGADVRGYFLWTFLDNFEWAEGYSERFGIIHVDYTSQRRYVKDSAFWYQKMIESNGATLSINQPDTKIVATEETRTLPASYKTFQIQGTQQIAAAGETLYIAEGSGIVGSIVVDKGTSLKIPAGMQPLTCAGNMTIFLLSDIVR